MRVLLLGGAGQLATSLSEALAGDELISLTHQDLDICEATAVSDAVRSVAPEVVVNTVAIRRPDDCEAAPDRAFAVNALGVRNVAQACSDSGCALLQVSTDNVFDGMKRSPYVERDAPNPITTYGMSKLVGEFFTRHLVRKHYVVRTSALFGGSGNRGESNFVLRTIRRASEDGLVSMATDQCVSPTYTVDLARKLAWLMRTGAYGTYHIANAGECTWYEFAKAIVAEAGLAARVEPTTTAALNLRAPRLGYGVLANGALREMGADDMPPWRDALIRYLRLHGLAKPDAQAPLLITPSGRAST